jgi:hypothetical protein
MYLLPLWVFLQVLWYKWFQYTLLRCILYSYRSVQRIRPGPRLLNDFRNKFIFLRWRIVSPTPNPQTGGPIIVVCRWLLIQYIRSSLHTQHENAPSCGDSEPITHLTWPLGRPRRRWVDLVEVGWADVDWIGLAQDRDRWRGLVNAVMNLRVP